MAKYQLKSIFCVGIMLSAFICVIFSLAIYADESQETQSPEQEKLVTNVFFDTSLRQAISDISAQTGVIIVTDLSVQGIVTCEFNDVPLDKALEILIAGTNYAVKKTPDYYLITGTDIKSSSFPIISETTCVKLNYIKADSAIKLLSPAFKDYVQANVDTGLVLITASKELKERIVSDLKLVDQAPKQVLLDTRIVVMEKSELSNLGLNWRWPQIQAGTFTNSISQIGNPLNEAGGIQWPWGAQIGYTPGRTFTDSLLLTLNLLMQNNQATIVSNPQLLAQDNKEAEIKVSSEEYFEVLTEGGIYTRSQLERIETGTTLTITPRISETGYITLDIKTEVSDVAARGENNLPVVTRRTTQGTVMIEDGGTAIIAGLTDMRQQYGKSKVPGLGDIAVVGHAFQNNNDKETSQQITAFVTAHIISNDGINENPKKVSRPHIKSIGEEFREALRESLARANEITE